MHRKGIFNAGCIHMPLNVCANLTAPALALAPSSPKLQPLNRSKKEEGTREDRRPKRKAAHVTFISIPLVERAALIKTYTLSPIYFCFVNKERETNYCLVLGDTSIGSLHLLFYLHTAVEREETKHKVWTSRAQLHAITCLRSIHLNTSQGASSDPAEKG